MKPAGEVRRRLRPLCPMATKFGRQHNMSRWAKSHHRLWQTMVDRRLDKDGRIIAAVPKALDKKWALMPESAVATHFPALSTDRLVMRAVSMDDISSVRVLLSIAEVTRYSNVPDSPTEEQTIEVVRNMSELYQSGDGCAWIIEDRLSHAFVGVFRFNWFHKPWKCGGIGYESHPDFWGRGLMTEALHVAIGCGHNTFGLNRIEAWTLPGNSASDRVLEKGGFRYEGTLRQKAWFKGAFHDFRMFGRVTGDVPEAMSG